MFEEAIRKRSRDFFDVVKAALRLADKSNKATRDEFPVLFS